jgi:hypothetical protein
VSRLADSCYGAAPMQRSATIGLGIILLVLVAAAIFFGRSSGNAAKPTPSSKPVASAPSPPPSATPQNTALETAVEAALSPDQPGEERGFDILPDGRKAPELPESAPSLVRFGVIQFAYQGSQFASPGTRSKEDAKKRALKAIEEAKTDFAAAAAKGDRGSTADAGRMPRGILEPAPEYLLFTLAKGQIYDQPVDTPRGYWVIRRID